MTEEKLKVANDLKKILDNLKKDRVHVLGPDFIVLGASKELFIKIKQMVLDEINNKIDLFEKEFEQL